jgi:hypothetical protein
VHAIRAPLSNSPLKKSLLRLRAVRRCVHGPRFTRLLIVFHRGEPGLAALHRPADLLAAIELVRSHGFQVAHISRRGLEFTFLRRR